MGQDSVDIVGITNTGDVQVFDGSGRSIVITSSGNSPVNDGKIIISDTDGTPGYISDKLGAGLSISGTNIIAVSDGKIMSTSGDTSGYLFQKIGVGLGTSGTNILSTGLIAANETDSVISYLQNKIGAGFISTGTSIALSTNAIIFTKYGTSTSTGTNVSLLTIKVVYGYCLRPGDDLERVSGLPFANTTSYSIIAVASGSYTSATRVVATPVSGTSADIFNATVNSNGTFWVAIGV